MDRHMEQATSASRDATEEFDDDAFEAVASDTAGSKDGSCRVPDSKFPLLHGPLLEMNPTSRGAGSGLLSSDLTRALYDANGDENKMEFRFFRFNSFGYESYSSVDSLPDSRQLSPVVPGKDRFEFKEFLSSMPSEKKDEQQTEARRPNPYPMGPGGDAPLLAQLTDATEDEVFTSASASEAPSEDPSLVRARKEIEQMLERAWEHQCELEQNLNILSSSLCIHGSPSAGFPPDSEADRAVIAAVSLLGVRLLDMNRFRTRALNFLRVPASKFGRVSGEVRLEFDAMFTRRTLDAMAETLQKVLPFPCGPMCIMRMGQRSLEDILRAPLGGAPNDPNKEEGPPLTPRSQLNPNAQPFCFSPPLIRTPWSAPQSPLLTPPSAGPLGPSSEPRPPRMFHRRCSNSQASEGPVSRRSLSFSHAPPHRMLSRACADNPHFARRLEFLCYEVGLPIPRRSAPQSPRRSTKETLPLPKRDPKRCQTVQHVLMVPTTGMSVNNPHGFDVCPLAPQGRGNLLWIADTNNHQIRAHDQTGALVHRWGTEGTGEGQLFFPRKVAVVGPLLAVVDRGSSRTRLQTFTTEGRLIRRIPLGEGIDIVSALCVTENLELVLVDSVVPAVYIMDVVGPVSRILSWFSTSMIMREPSDCAAFRNDIYLCDFKAHAVFIYDRFGHLKHRLGTPLLTPYPSGILIGRGGRSIVTIDSHGNHPHLTFFQRDTDQVFEFEARGVRIPRVTGLKMDADGNLLTCAKSGVQSGRFRSTGQIVKFVLPMNPLCQSIPDHPSATPHPRSGHPPMGSTGGEAMSAYGEGVTPMDASGGEDPEDVRQHQQASRLLRKILSFAPEDIPQGAADRDH